MYLYTDMFSHFFEFVTRHTVAISVIAGLILIKIIWVGWGTSGIGDFESERDDILQRRDYLVDKVIVHPRKLIGTMPAAVGWQYQGEWALYSCSMLAEALANIAELYPDCKGETVENIGSATFFNDSKFRNRLLRTAEIAGHTVKWNDRRHYLLADIALVGEAIALAMRTNHP